MAISSGVIYYVRWMHVCMELTKHVLNTGGRLGPRVTHRPRRTHPTPVTCVYRSRASTRRDHSVTDKVMSIRCPRTSSRPLLVSVTVLLSFDISHIRPAAAGAAALLKRATPATLPTCVSPGRPAASARLASTTAARTFARHQSGGSSPRTVTWTPSSSRSDPESQYIGIPMA